MICLKSAIGNGLITGEVMNQILVINSGSSSLKISLFHHAKGAFHHFLDAHFRGLHAFEASLKISVDGHVNTHTVPQNLGIAEALPLVLDIMASNYAFSPAKISTIGHRVVHGGSHYRASVRINSTVMADLEKLICLAPLHNEACLVGIKSCLACFGSNIVQVAVFDTAFYRSMPAVASLYAIDRNVGEKYGIKRYGFHGISHAFLWLTYLKHKGASHQEAKVITMHLGNGCSMTAIRGGIAVDTSMGFTPAEGLIMGTRAGDIDAAIVEFLCVNDRKTVSEVTQQLNNASGLLGISGISSDMTQLLSVCHEKSEAQLALDMFCYRVRKYLGSYLSVLEGVEAIIFSGGIGENAPKIRQQIVHGMEWYGIQIDEQLNNQAVDLRSGQVEKISMATSTVDVYVIATDENLFIAKEGFLINH